MVNFGMSILATAVVDAELRSPTVTTVALPTVTAVNDGDEGGILSVQEEPSYV